MHICDFVLSGSVCCPFWIRKYMDPNKNLTIIKESTNTKETQKSQIQNQL